MIAVGPHDQTAGDVYATLLEALDLDVPDDERQKPPCCDDEGQPPSGESVAALISEAMDRVTRRTRTRER